jgi:hypothetical protein
MKRRRRGSELRDDDLSVRGKKKWEAKEDGVGYSG